jgi:predicted ATPase
MPFALSLVNASKANPILLHLEHLHWADQPSLQLLQHLARRFKGSHLMVVGSIATSNLTGVTRFPRCSRN